ncbi:hypothetical protein ACHWQZ_G008703 [Mnemiopsis leidyi]
MSAKRSELPVGGGDGPHPHDTTPSLWVHSPTTTLLKQHAEATTSEDFILPSTCTSTRRDEPSVLYDGKTYRGVLNGD